MKFYFDKDNFTWYNYLSVLFNLYKEVNSSFVSVLLNTNHETISLQSNQLKYFFNVYTYLRIEISDECIIKKNSRSPELWKCYIPTSLRLLVPIMWKYNYDFFFFKYIVAFISHTQESNHSFMRDQCCLNWVTKQKSVSSFYLGQV